MTIFTDFARVLYCMHLGYALSRIAVWFAAACMSIALCGIVRGEERVKSWFQRETPVAAPAPIAAVRSEPEPLQIESADIVETDEPRFEVRPPAFKPVVITSVSSFLRQAVEFYEDLPEGVDEQNAEDFQPIELTGYTIPNCVHCPAVRARFDADPRVKVNWVETGSPWKDGDGFRNEYPELYDKQSHSLFRGEKLATVDTFFSHWARKRQALNLSASYPELPELPDKEIGLMIGGLMSLLSCEGGPLRFKNASETFTHGQYTIGIPAGFAFESVPEGHGNVIKCVGAKPTIKRNGWLQKRHTIGSIFVGQNRRGDRVTTLRFTDWLWTWTIKERS